MAKEPKATKPKVPLDPATNRRRAAATRKGWKRRKKMLALRAERTK